ncbi:MAG: glycosyltransferase family 2 protein [Clostridia bacterium]|nr:glycosyltransferase family 2 protein [Clostridia bacterium]
MKKISLIIPVYNAEPWFQEMLNSVLAQTWPHIQLVIVNDGSTDRSEDIFLGCEPALKERLSEVIYLRHEQNLSASEAINTALPWCDGEYLCWADADDVLHPDSIRKKAEYLDRFPSLAMVRHNSVIFLQNSGRYAEIAKPEDKQVKNIFEDLLFSRTFCCPGCYMLRSEVFFACYPGRKIPVSRQGQNMQMLLPPASVSDCGYMDDRLFLYRIHGANHSLSFSRFPDLLERKKEFEQLQLRVLPHCRCDREWWEARIHRYWQQETEDLKKSYLSAIRRHKGI